MLKDHDDINLSLPLEERLVLKKDPGKNILDIPNIISHNVNSNELDDFMQAVCIFKRINKIGLMNPTHSYYIMKRLGYEKR